MLQIANASELFSNFSCRIFGIEDLKKLTIVDEITGCWNWKFGKDGYGYGRATYKKQPIGTHRLAYILTHPEEELETKDLICHSCDNPSCCNPEHVFKGTILINNQDSLKKGRRRHQKLTHCSKGHLRSSANGYIFKRKDGRERYECKICCSERSKQQYRNRKEMELGIDIWVD